MKNSTSKAFLCLLAVFFCVSCSSSDPASPQAPAFSGAWGLDSIGPESDIRVYSKLDALAGDQVGYMFGSGGTLMVRSAGWCGTPPLSYSNFEGTWIEEQRNNLVLTYSQWDGMHEFRLVILSLSEDEMRCRVDVVE